jgi:hypothetical protein
VEELLTLNVDVSEFTEVFYVDFGGYLR